MILRVDQHQADLHLPFALIAFNQLYQGSCNGTWNEGGTTKAPNVLWSYNTGTGYITETSPVLSYLDDGQQVAFMQRSGNSLQISVIGTSDQVTIQDWYLGQAGHVEQIRTSTGRVLLDTKVDALVSAMAAMVPPAAGQTSLTASQQMLLAPVLAASWS